jgi:hypothetical protein
MPDSKSSPSLADFLRLTDPAPGQPAPDHPDPLDALIEGTLTLQEFAERVLTSREYRLSVIQRVQLGELPAAIERWLYELAVPKSANPLMAGDASEPMIVEIRRVMVRPALDEDEETTPTRTH